MGLEQVIAEVRRDGEARAKAVIDEANAEAERILAIRKERQAQADRDATHARAQILSGAEFAARKTVLQEENTLRAALRENLLAHFAGLPAKTREKHLTALLRQAKNTVPAGKVWGAEKDKAALQKTGYTFAGAAPIAGGIIVESEDGSIRLDLSYETLLADMWRDVLRSEAALFQ
jgi:V/A-type H+/Na+-transporting ATPase subunit E